MRYAYLGEVSQKGGGVQKLCFFWGGGIEISPQGEETVRKAVLSVRWKSFKKPLIRRFTEEAKFEFFKCSFKTGSKNLPKGGKDKVRVPPPGVSPPHPLAHHTYAALGNAVQAH